MTVFRENYSFVRDNPTDPDAEQDEFVGVVTFDATPFVPAQTYGPAENCYPAEGGEIEIHSFVVTGQTESLAMTEAEEDAMVQWLEENPSWAGRGG